MNFEFAVAHGLDKTNQTFLPQDMADMMFTSAIGISMMTLQNAWTTITQHDLDVLNDDYAKYAGDSEAQSAHLQADQMQYKIDSSAMDSATSEYRSTFDAAKQQVTSDTENEKNFTSVDTSVTSIASTVTNLVQRGSGMGKQASG